MHDRHGVAEAAAETAHRLRGERDLGHEHARRAPLRKNPLDGLQIHLGLARSRDAVHEHHVTVGGIASGGNGVERMRLARRELGLRRRGKRLRAIAGRQDRVDAKAARFPAGPTPIDARYRALRHTRRIFGKPAHAATMLDDHRALRLQGLERGRHRPQLRGQLAHAQLTAAQGLHDRDLLDGIRPGRELLKRRPCDHPSIVHLADCGLLEAPTAVAPVHHARHAARRREQAHTCRQRRDIALGEPQGARSALFVEVRLADGALDCLELARIDALRPLRPAGLPIFAKRHHEAHGAPVTERHQHRTTHRDGEIAPERAVVAITGAFACGGEQPLLGDCIGIRRIERLRGYVQDHRCQFHSAPVYQRFAESLRKGEQIYAF